MGITVVGTKYTVNGTVENKANNQPIVEIKVTAYDKDLLRDDFLGIAVTNAKGEFSLIFDASDFKDFGERKGPELYFIVIDGGTEVLNTSKAPIKNAATSSDPIVLKADLSDDILRTLINDTAVPGWVGGYLATGAPAWDYPDPNLSSMGPLQGNMDNITPATLQRQQKVVWPEFSWLTEPDETDTKRCYQMFAPDISRLGYRDDGKVYSIICPQQGACTGLFGCLNVEVTVTGNRGWVTEGATKEDREVALDMSVVGKIWFSPEAHNHPTVILAKKHAEKKGIPFPSSKAEAIVINTYNPEIPTQVAFPLLKGEGGGFPIPEYARHPLLSYSVAWLGVLIGGIEPSGNDAIDKFNQLILNIFNLASGNMLKKGTTLTWNVWFTSPELVSIPEWEGHAIKWRDSIDAAHGSPDGPAATPRFYDGAPFNPVASMIKEELGKILEYLTGL